MDDQRLSPFPLAEETSYFVTTPVQSVWLSLRSAWRSVYQYFTQHSTEAGEQFTPLTGYAPAVGAMGLRFLVDVINITLLSAVSEEENASAIAGTGLAVLFLVAVPTNMILYRFQAHLSDGYLKNELLKPWLTALMAVAILASINYTLLMFSKNFLGALNDNEQVVEGAELLIRQYLYCGGPLFFLMNTVGIVASSSTKSSHFDVIANTLRAIIVLSLSAWYLNETGPRIIQGFATTFVLGGLMVPSLVHTVLLLRKHWDKFGRRESRLDLFKHSVQDSLKVLYAGLPYMGSAICEAGSFAVVFNVIAPGRGVPTLQALNGYSTLRGLFLLPLGVAGQYAINLAVRLQMHQKDLNKIKLITNGYLRCTVLVILLGGAVCMSITPRFADLYGAKAGYFTYENMALWCAGITFNTLGAVGEGWLRGVDKSALAMGINAMAFIQFPAYSYLFLEKDLGFRSFPLAYCLSQVFSGVSVWVMIAYCLKRQLPKKLTVLPVEVGGDSAEEDILYNSVNPALQIERFVEAVPAELQHEEQQKAHPLLIVS